MPRFHFHITNGERDIDYEGTDLASLKDARQQAVLFGATMLRDRPELVWREGTWRVEVTDCDGCLLFTIVVLAIEAPQLDRRG
ncbi:hypothetical protein [Jiella sp. M17.18]|uniref:DUF6894 family protein n=1 Tax=Jiella sp. M17.18 TaxID=3234247 RepID=UPI0034E00632